MPLRASASESFSVVVLQSGAGYDASLVFPGQVAGSFCDRIQPWVAIFVGERNAGRHFGDIFPRVQVVSLEEFCAQSGGECTADHCFAGAGNSHDDYDHDGIVPDDGNRDKWVGPIASNSQAEIQFLSQFRDRFPRRSCASPFFAMKMELRR